MDGCSSFILHMESEEPRNGIIAIGRRVILRDRQIDDADRFTHWQSHGEWLSFDAPWERKRAVLSSEEVTRIKEKFLSGCDKELPQPRTRGMIATTDGHLIGFVNRYPHDRFPDLFLIGMSICEDEYLNQGYGTEALQLWIDYLFAAATVHRIGAATWSFNPRAIALLKKVGFAHEGTERELHHWGDRWHDRLQFGLLRQEWEGNKKAGSADSRRLL